ncbi:MAG: hypothetical protein RL398_2451 [Planctomycetota bacterium]|jgi:hypothetical protein
MRPAFAIASGLLTLAACLGVGLQQHRRSEARAGEPQGGLAASDFREIDRADVVRMPPIPVAKDFGDRAFAHAEAIVAFGPRYSGTPGWSQQIDYIAGELEKLGLTVERDTWTDRKELKTFTNLSAKIPGKHKDRILLACHHDTKCTVGHQDPAHNFHFVGANDGASGVAFLLALAPALIARKSEATYELVFFDGEESLDWKWNDAERALFGSKRYVKRHRDAELLGDVPPIRGLVLFDMVGRKDLHIQEELYSTPALRRLVWSAAVACGHRDSFYRRAEAASDDHIPFLDVGIPAVDLIDLNGNPYWHTKDDTLANMSAASLQKVGDVTLTMLPELERTLLPKRD